MFYAAALWALKIALGPIVTRHDSASTTFCDGDDDDFVDAEWTGVGEDGEGDDDDGGADDADWWPDFKLGQQFKTRSYMSRLAATIVRNRGKIYRDS